MGKYAKQVTAHKETQTQMKEEGEEEEEVKVKRGSIQWGVLKVSIYNGGNYSRRL